MEGQAKAAKLYAQISDNGDDMKVRAYRAKETAARKFARIQPWLWKPGQSGNPTGKSFDLAALIARRAFEADPVGIQKALLRQLRTGSVRAFQCLADRAYGLLPRPVDIRMDATVTHLPAELVEMVEELEGTTREVP